MSEYIHAALLLHSASKEINEENLKAIIKAAGIEPDEAKIKALVESLSSINIDEVLSTPVAVAPIAAQPTEETKPKEEEKKEEEEEEITGLGALFG
ncbi:50S ribosomal protein P1 [Candidatus Bathyarchaeota archaeon ex4484_205]|nr:MAG: 50S ribosomal protein P1 [Candidatus Bathyarchaeota archaeon ex4484_205]RLG67695.1 MAG: 50S ribosomal protein P1 [archaeon]HDN17461.1 50S ribosomal protein P1 [Candidatus Bathyarchaeota archaeon]